MKLQRIGFTLVELLCVIVILAVVSAIVFPVVVRARMGAKVTSAKTNLKNLWMALQLYQENYGERVEYGAVSDMGLPSAGAGYGNFLDEYTHQKRGSWLTWTDICPCGTHVGSEANWGIFYFGDHITDWPKDVQKYKDSTIVLADKNCNDSSVRIDCQFCKKRSIGIALSGKLVDKTNDQFNYWTQNFYQK